MPGAGAKDTHALIGTFRARVGQPDQVFITGHSMGGHVTGVAIERWAQAFAGAVPMCGVMGDSELFDYFQDTYLLAEHFAGNTPAIPTPDDYYSSNSHVATFASLGFFGPALSPGGEDYQDAIEQLTGGERPTFEQGFFGGSGAFFPFNFQFGTVYRLDGTPPLSPEEVALNEAIPRVDARPQTRHPNGMEQIYARRAAAHGNDDLLVVRAIRDTGHCGFTVSDQIQAFADVVRWVQTDVRPAGDDILDPLAVADPDFGCAFTSVNRPGLDPCG